jgi:hypothetical protein
MSSVIIAGNTSGTITLDAPNVAGTTTLTLPTTSGTVLTSVSSVAKAQLPAGSILQVVQYTDETTNKTCNGTGATLDTVTGSITPSSTNSKILVMANIYGGFSGSGQGATAMWLRRGSTDIKSSQTGTGNTGIATVNNSRGYSDGDQMGGGTFNYLDSPSTTSSTTYTVRIAMRTDSSNAFRLNACWSYSTNNQGYFVPTVSQLILMEIAG